MKLYARNKCPNTDYFIFQCEDGTCRVYSDYSEPCVADLPKNWGFAHLPRVEDDTSVS